MAWNPTSAASSSSAWTAFVQPPQPVEARVAARTPSTVDSPDARIVERVTPLHAQTIGSASPEPLTAGGSPRTIVPTTSVPR